MEKKEDFFKKLKETLDDTTVFPAAYLYKFIIPSNQEKLKSIEKVFDYSGAVITTKPSKTGKYISISVNMMMKDSASIIGKYEEVAKIKGVISL